MEGSQKDNRRGEVMTTAKLSPIEAARVYARDLEALARIFRDLYRVPLDTARAVVAYLFQVEINGAERSPAREFELLAELKGFSR